MLSEPNAKVRRLLARLGHPKAAGASFALPAGRSCPKAKDCHAWAKEGPGGRLLVVDGPEMRFRCFAASQEAFYRNVYDRRAKNYDAMRQALAVGGSYLAAEVLLGALSERPGLRVLRVHDSGDFFSREYAEAWTLVARARPDIVFYGYTKSGFVAELDRPSNFRFAFSVGSADDGYAHFFPSRAHVVGFAGEAIGPVDDDDWHACSGYEGDFSLVVHGTQPKGGHRIGRELSVID